MRIRVTLPKVEPSVYETPETCPYGCGGRHFKPHGVKGEVKPLRDTRYSEVRSHRLKHEGGIAILPELRARVAAHPEQPQLAEALAYLEQRVTMMDYPEYLRQGWPIGSGSVESANKVVVESRLKGAGMHWARQHVNPMLSLRNAICSDRWSEAWQDILTRQRQERQQCYLERAKQRTIVPLPPPLTQAPAAPVLPATEAQPTPPKQRWCPPPDHPWRHSLGAIPHRRSRSAEK